MKYKILQDTKKSKFNTLVYRIQATRDFADVIEGQMGGYIEREYNLSQHDDCWLYDNSVCMQNARVHENCQVRNNSQILHDAQAYGKSSIYNSIVCGHAKVFNNAQVKDADITGNAWVFSNSICTKSPITLSGDFFPITICDNVINVGIFSHTVSEWMVFSDAKAQSYGVSPGDLYRLRSIISIFEERGNVK